MRLVREAGPEDVGLVNKWVKRDSGERVDFTGFFSRPENVCLICGEGGALFVSVEPGVYEVHVCFEQRGKEVIDLSHRMLGWMRSRHGAERFVGVIPHDDTRQSRKVRMFTRLMGWESQGLHDLPQGRCEIFIGE